MTLVWWIAGRWTKCPVEGSQLAVIEYRWPNSKQPNTNTQKQIHHNKCTNSNTDTNTKQKTEKTVHVNTFLYKPLNSHWEAKIMSLIFNFSLVNRVFLGPHKKFYILARKALRMWFSWRGNFIVNLSGFLSNKNKPILSGPIVAGGVKWAHIYNKS